ncbi:hypothetical protein KSP40_PGU021577 [Platanthera guangdongensis]|uniref:Uncharacterized protein n=1 Tax=Platanthera guangdongensis TaxID=2320717 RepID=A0ABR2LSU8_9ASPA
MNDEKTKQKVIDVVADIYGMCSLILDFFSSFEIINFARVFLFFLNIYMVCCRYIWYVADKAESQRSQIAALLFLFFLNISIKSR